LGNAFTNAELVGSMLGLQRPDALAVEPGPPLTPDINVVLYGGHCTGTRDKVSAFFETITRKNNTCFWIIDYYIRLRIRPFLIPTLTLKR